MQYALGCFEGLCGGGRINRLQAALFEQGPRREGPRTGCERRLMLPLERRPMRRPQVIRMEYRHGQPA